MNANNTNRPSKDDPRQGTLFALPEEDPVAQRPIGGGRPRLRCANRRQIEFRAMALDDLLPEDLVSLDRVAQDGGFVKKDDIMEVAPPKGKTTVYAPVMQSKTDKRDPHTPCGDDSEAVAQWRLRMATPEAKEIYKQRAATAECVNVIARNRGLQQFRVRGSPRVKAVILWYVLAHNLIRAVASRAKAEAVSCSQSAPTAWLSPRDERTIRIHFFAPAGVIVPDANNCPEIDCFTGADC